MTTILWLAAAVPSPSPSGVDVAPSKGGSPGFAGFVATFLLAAALVALFGSLTRQLRIVNRRAAQREAEEAATLPGGTDTGAAGPDLEVDGGDGPAGTGPDGARRPGS